MDVQLRIGQTKFDMLSSPAVSSEAPAPVRRTMRKGTHSCLECKKTTCTPVEARSSFPMKLTSDQVEDARSGVASVVTIRRRASSASAGTRAAPTRDWETRGLLWRKSNPI